ncbi:hypothetical protein ISCGN_026582 [Ixodes scapularis]
MPRPNHLEGLDWMKRVLYFNLTSIVNGGLQNSGTTLASNCEYLPTLRIMGSGVGGSLSSSPAVCIALKESELLAVSLKSDTSPEDLSSPQGSSYIRPKTVGKPPPSCSNECIVPSKEGAPPSKEPDVPLPAPAGPSGRGRGLPPRASGSSSKPGRSDSPLPPKGPKVSMDEKMDVSVSLSDEDLPLSQTGSVSSASCEAGGRPKDTAKKKTTPRIVAPKDI